MSRVQTLRCKIDLGCIAHEKKMSASVVGVITCGTQRGLNLKGLGFRFGLLQAPEDQRLVVSRRRLQPVAVPCVLTTP